MKRMADMTAAQLFEAADEYASEALREPRNPEALVFATLAQTAATLAQTVVISAAASQ